MTFRERMVRRFGSPLPGYIERAVALRERFQARREQDQRDHEAKIEAERARIQALRRPPQNVRLHSIFGGRKGKVTWEPPETAGQLPPAGYWISEQRNGEWTKHGDFVLPHIREAILYGTGPANVETWYHQLSSREGYSARAVPVEGERQAEPDCPKDRLRDIVIATKTYRGRRTRDGRPWLRPLRRHAGIPDITSPERDEAHRIAGGEK